MINGSDWFVRNGPQLRHCCISLILKQSNIGHSTAQCYKAYIIVVVLLSHLAGGYKLIVQIIRRHFYLLHGSLLGCEALLFQEDKSR